MSIFTKSANIGMGIFATFLPRGEEFSGGVDIFHTPTHQGKLNGEPFRLQKLNFIHTIHTINRSMNEIRMLLFAKTLTRRYEFVILRHGQFT
jgi:hypothetical protein